MTTKYRYIGKGTTDSNGIAHMTEDADGQTVTGYTGTGKGLTDIIASTDDSTKISDSSILSETFSVLDNMFYDTGVTGTKNDNWQNIRLNTPVTDETGTLLTANGNYAHYLVVNSNQRFSVPVAVEFDVLETSYSSSKPSLNIVDNGFDSKPQLDSNSHYKFEIDSTGFKLYKNGTYVSTVTGNLSNVRISIFLSSTGDTLKYANFMIYPI